MVGVPRSSGCQLCRRRRVKCNEARPECGNCLKYGVQCPGYERAIKFVSGKHQIRSKGSRQAHHGSAGSASSSQSTASSSSGSTFPAVSLVASPTPNRALFIGTLMETAQERLSRSEVTGFLGFFSWLQLEKLGTTAALDGALCSLALHLVGKETADETLVAQSRTLYGQSLNSLQATLRHPTKWRSSETLYSAVLLCFFELFAGTTSPDTWLQHSRGIAVLMEQRGPAAHADGADAAILLSFRGILIMSQLFYPTGDTCFLARPEWKVVVCDGGRHLIHPPEVSNCTIQVVDGFFERLAELPEVLWSGYPIREARMAGMTVDSRRVEKLAKLASQNHERFSKWYEDFKLLGVMPQEVPSKDPNSLYQWVLEYRISWLGSMHMAYWASMLTLQELLMQCEWPVSYEESQRELVQNILRSVESVGRGVMGPHRFGYSLRIAYEFANVEAQQWIRNLLDKFSQSYAATDKTTYPSPRIDQKGYS